MPPVGPCRFCADWPRELAWASSGYWLGREAREIVHHLKYEGFFLLGRAVAAAVARVIPAPGKACLLPIPLSSARLRERGYNQAAAIARPLSDLWDVELSETILWRARETRSQTSLTPEQRMANVSGAFGAQPPAGDAGTTLVLVDDVLTTGATLVAAARALADVGWTAIGAVTFGRALPFEVRVGSQYH
ncbi:MAG: ComF family protein [Gemmatimonadales bacterium]